MGNISAISHEVRLSALQELPRGMDEDFLNANTDIIFNVREKSTNDENVLNLKIIYQLTNFPEDSEIKYRIGLEFTGMFLDPERTVEADLLSEESIKLFASLYKHCGELLLKELARIREETGSFRPVAEDLEISREHAMENTRQMMQSYVAYLNTIN